MPLTLKRSSVVTQVADAIRSEIMAHAWEEWIPSERDLSTILHVGRNTCRRAVQILREESLVEPVIGCGLRINRHALGRTTTPHALQTVGLITPELIGGLRPEHALLIDELRDELFASGVRLELHCSPIYYNSRPQRALERLVEKNHHECWILLLSHEPLQRWFAEQGLRCIVSGSVYPGIALPSVGQDFRAACRHAAARLIALGHRRLIFFNRNSRAAGDLESEAGFLEAAQEARPEEGVVQIAYHGDTRESILKLIHRVYAASDPPTGILVANSYCYLSLVSGLARLGYRIPADVSVISRDDDVFLSYVNPQPAHYSIHPGSLLRYIMQLLRPLLAGETVGLSPLRVLPDFVEGESCRAIAGG